MKNNTNNRLALWLTLIIYWALTFGLLQASLQKTKGHFGYPLDDTYIHMAIARHVAEDGVWGVSMHEFSSSTSSPLWTFLITLAYIAFGVNDWTPLALSTLVGSLTIYACYRLLLNNLNNPIRLTALLIIILLFVPLPILTLTGMEHILHGLLTLLLIYYSADYLSNNQFTFRSFLLLIALANLTVATRYEGTLLVFTIGIVFFIKKRFSEGIAFGGFSLTLIAIYGVWSVLNGWRFFPNSILLKGNSLSFTIEGMVVFIEHTMSNFYNSSFILVLLALISTMYLRFESAMREKEQYLIILSATAVFLHMLFASIGWFFRYEAYLILILIVVIADIFNKYFVYQEETTKRLSVYNYGARLSLAFLFVIPLTMRAITSFVQYPFAVTNIYEQQYQMGLFIKKYYSGQCVAVNDIGAISYLADICLIDLYGLANIEVLNSRLQGSFEKDEIESLVAQNNTQVIIIYNEWFEGNIPDVWEEVGRWKISNNVVCASNVVAFYAPDETLQPSVIENLQDFSAQLPEEVEQLGAYLQ